MNFLLVYLITFRCYGAWLHGDERGAVDRSRNQYGAPYIPPNDRWRTYNQQALKHPAVNLTDPQRKSVEAAIRETCKFHDWSLLAINVRTNHVHSLLSCGATQPARVLNALKANATRQLRQDGNWSSSHTVGSYSPWSGGGSKRYVWTELGIERAREYVANGREARYRNWIGNAEGERGEPSAVGVPSGRRCCG